MYGKSKGEQDQSHVKIINWQARVEELEKKLLKHDELEQMLEESEQRFKQILSLTYDGIILYERDTGEIIEANIRLIHKLKYKQDNVIGGKVYEFVIPEQRDIIKERLKEDLPNVYEAIILDKDGRMFDFEVCSRSCYYHGRKVKIAAICDISYRKQYEKTLKESEEKFRSLAENTSDSIILTNRDELLYANPFTSHIFGLTGEPVVQLEQILTHIHPEDLTMAEALIHSVIEGQRKTKYCQFRIVTKNREIRWIWSRVFPVVHDNPNDTKLVILSSDITEMREKEELQRKTEIAAKAAEEKYKILTSLLPEMIIETDINGQMTFVNLKTMEVFEYGSDFYYNNLNFIELICNEDRRHCTDNFQQIIEGNVNVTEAEYMAVTQSGRKFPIALYTSRMYTNSEFSGLSIIMFDKTEQKFSEQKELNYQENMSFLSNSALKFLTFSSDDDIFIFIGKSLSKFASKSIIVVFSYDQPSNISNIRYISGIYPHINELLEILGKPPEDFNIKLPSKFKSKYLSGKTLKKLNEGLLNVLADDWSYEKALHIQQLLHVDHFYSMGMARDGKLYGGLLIAVNSKTEPIDIQTIETFIYQAGVALHRKQIDNELEKAKLAAEESDRLKSAFLANMSHEVRTPLNGILGLAQVLLKSEDVDQKIRNDVKMIVESGSSLLTLIEDIMDVSRIEAGQMKIKFKPFFLNSLIDQLYSMFLANPLYLQKNAVQANLELKYDKPSENVTIMSDPDRLQQIFVNLIGNALKFTQKGFVHFGYTIKKQEIIFYVKDSGIGIPEDKTEKIFDRFTQVDNTLARKFSGSGLGLAISKGLVTLLNGKIWCESNFGKGSNFYFTIPYHPTTMIISANTPIKKTVVKYDWSKYTVLIVEDDMINFKVIEAMLRNTKIHVFHAENGVKSIEYIRLYPHINLVLMDVHLPEMSGLEATVKILKINPELPIIAQTANAMSEDKDKCLEAGCVDYISKPIDMNELVAKISKYLPD